MRTVLPAMQYPGLGGRAVFASACRAITKDEAQLQAYIIHSYMLT